MPTDDTVDVDRDVVFGLDHLSRNTSELNLDVCHASAPPGSYDFISFKPTDNPDRLGADIDLDQTGVDRLVELSESRDQTD